MSKEGNGEKFDKIIARLKNLAWLCAALSIAGAGAFATLRGIYHVEFEAWELIVVDYTPDENGKTAVEALDIRITNDSIAAMAYMMERDLAAKKKPAINILRVDADGQLWYIDADLQEYPAYEIVELSSPWFAQYAYIDKLGNEHYAN